MTTLLDRLNSLDPEQRRYTLDTLVDRLRDVDQFGRLRILFSNDEWMHCHYDGDGGVYDGYLLDLRVAWEAMAGEARRQIDSESDGPAIADAWRIALIHTSLNSIAGNYAPALVTRAIQTGLWTTEKAVGVVPNVADELQQLEIYLVVLETEGVDPLLRMKVIKAALDLTIGLDREDHRSAWLAKLAPHLDSPSLGVAMNAATALDNAEARVSAMLSIGVYREQPQRTALLTEALSSVQSLNPQARANVIISIIPRLHGRNRARAVKAAIAATHSISSLRDRVRKLSSLVELMTGAAAAKVTRQVREELWKLDSTDFAYTLQHVLPHLPRNESAQIAHEALERIKDYPDMDMEYDSPRPIALMALAAHLDDEGLERALAMVDGMSEGGHLTSMRARTLTNLAAQLTGEKQGRVIAKALELVRATEWGPDLAAGLTHLIPLVAPSSRDVLVQDALRAAVTLWDEKPNNGLLGEVSPRLEALSELAPYLAGDSLSQALSDAQVIKDNKERAETLISLAQLLTDDARQNAMQLAFEAVWAIRNDQMGIFTIREVFNALEGDIVTTAFEAIETLPKSGYPNHWVDAFVALAPHLSSQQLERAAETVKGLKNATDRAEAYTAIVAGVDAARRECYQRLILESVRQLPDYVEHLTAYAIRDAAPYLHGEHADAAWNILHRLQGFERSEAMMAIASQLTGDTALAAFAVIRDLQNPYHRVVGLIRLSAALPEKESAEARVIAFESAIRMKKADLDSEKAILVLLPYLEGDARDQALKKGVERAAYLGNSEYGARTFSQLAAFMSGTRKAKALEEALKRSIRIEDTTVRADILAGIFAQMDVMALERALATIQAIADQNVRYEVQASFAHFFPRADIQPVRNYIVERLSGLRERARREMLVFLGHPAVFAQPAISNEWRTRLVDDISEICWRWRWR